MSKINAYVESFKTKHEAFLIGCDAIEELELWDKDLYGEMDAFYSNDMVSIIIRLIASDGSISAKEVEYLNKTFGFDYTLDELVEVYENCKENIDQAFDENFENGISHMRRINSKLADAYKDLLLLICDIVVNSDGVISDKETEEIRKLKELCK